MSFFLIIGSTFLVSLISLVGVLTLAVKDRLLNRVLFCLIGFSAGALLASAFLHILPEALLKAKSEVVFSFLMLGIISFFLMEKYFYWRHCHAGVCDVHAFTYLNLIGDGVHNFIDGMIIAVSFLASVKLGLVTTLAIIFHEIPQELSDFGVLVYGGFSKKKALFFNFICALMAIIGAILGYYIDVLARDFSVFLLSFTSGGFIYIAASDLIPEIHKVEGFKRSVSAFLAFLSGIGFMVLAKMFLPG